MERTIVKTEQEWNGSHAYLEGVDYDLPGWAEIPDTFQSIWLAYKPFVDIAINEDGAITSMTKGKKILPAIDSVRPQKLSELSATCNATILAGCDVELSNDSGHISLTNEDQINLTNAAAAVEAGAKEYPYHLDGRLCTMYSAADILLMAQAATAHKLYHTTYYNHLAAWVKRCTTSAEIQQIFYGSELPEDLAANMTAILGAMTNA